MLGVQDRTVTRGNSVDSEGHKVQMTTPEREHVRVLPFLTQTETGGALGSRFRCPSWVTTYLLTHWPFPPNKTVQPPVSNDPPGVPTPTHPSLRLYWGTFFPILRPSTHTPRHIPTVHEGPHCSVGSRGPSSFSDCGSAG